MSGIGPGLKSFYVVASLIGVFLLTASKIDAIYLFFKIPTTALTLAQNLSIILGAILQASFGIRIIYIEKRNSDLKSQINVLIENYKALLQIAIQKTLKCGNSFNVRIFLPKCQSKIWFHRKIFQGTVFCSKKIIGFSYIPGLEFEVNPNKTGVLGECFQLKDFVIENNLSGNEKKYNLTPQQKFLTMNCRFCICCPVMEKEEIIAIVTLDSDHIINELNNDENKEKENALKTLFGGFVQNMHENLPHIFKQGGN